MALMNGKHEAIGAYGTLLDKVPESMREAHLAELIAAKDADGTPGLAWALLNDHHEAIKAYGALLDKMPVDMREIHLDQLIGVLDQLIATITRQAPQFLELWYDNNRAAFLAFKNLMGARQLNTPRPQ
ncbi:hypothetical protein [Pseudochelatococcus sp. G4_1912]|uniref:hypothetical protein n=1 Tax=Pseudochelatococcus sp. G4_1912 TaxID=3114288 RepID=UPI0039C61FA8